MSLFDLSQKHIIRLVNGTAGELMELTYDRTEMQGLDFDVFKIRNCIAELNALVKLLDPVVE